jgi:UDP-glucose 4-epimerase
MEFKVLVTGGLGYIGSHTTIELANAGFIPIIVDNLSNSRLEILKRIAAIIGFEPVLHVVDLCDTSAVKLLSDREPSIRGIIHFAAYKAVAESTQEPLLYYRNNLVSLLNILEAYKSQSISFIFSSSCTVYGRPDKLPVTELTPLKAAQCPYGETKQMAEKILADITISNRNLRVLSLRYFNPVGAHESGLIGELSLGTPCNLVPVITETAINKRPQFMVFGSDYNTKDGTSVRDYVHVTDIAKAHVCALRKTCSDQQLPGYNVYNLGTGTGYSILEIIKTFEQVSGVKVNYIFGPRRPGDVSEIWADVTKVENELKWKAQLNLEAMLLSAWNWEKNMKETAI